MGTRSNIVRENQDGSYDSIYCHWDGYPEHNGKILYEHYQDPAKIAELLALGDLSVLAQEIGEKHDFEWQMAFFAGGLNPADVTGSPYYKMCTAYGRDRGEAGTEAKHYTKEQLAEMLQDGWTEWVYFFRVADGKWYYTNNPSPTWFKCCGTEQRETEELTPAAWAEQAAEV